MSTPRVLRDEWRCEIYLGFGEPFWVSLDPTRGMVIPCHVRFSSRERAAEMSKVIGQLACEAYADHLLKAVEGALQRRKEPLDGSPAIPDTALTSSKAAE